MGQSRTVIQILLAVILLVGCTANTVMPTEMPLSTATPTLPPTATPSPMPSPTPDIPEPTRPLLMAHYMPWYQTPFVTGYWGWHWTMNHFNPFRKDENGRPDMASYYLPLTGLYDSSDEALLEYQVLLMRLSGIDGMIVDWYGMKDFWDYATLNAATARLFVAIKKAGLRFAICYEDQSIMHMVNNKHLPAGEAYTHAQEVMRYLHDTWFQDEAYLKVLDRPVLFVFGPQYFKNASDWKQIFSVLDTPPALITLDGHTESAGLTSYPWPPMWAGKDGVLDQKTLEGYLTSFYKKATRWDYVVGGAFPGFKDIYKDAGVSTEARYLDSLDGETFRLTMQMALDQKPDLIQLITWNDYGESTSIEPTEEFGYQYLEMVQDARRSTDPAGFPFVADDLRLPLRLFELRQKYAGDAAVNARLDRVFEAILSGDLDAARAVLAEYPLK